MAAPTIPQFFPGSSFRTSESDNIILALGSINPRRDPEAMVQPDEFKLQGEQYIRCEVLAKGPKATTKRTSVIWIYGEDLRAKRDVRRGWYCYLCEKQRSQQELPAVSNGNSTALDHLDSTHKIDKVTGESNLPRRLGGFEPAVDIRLPGHVVNRLRPPPRSVQGTPNPLAGLLPYHFLPN
ncbi:hypothetical protein BKA63DRAFT_554688 [Paraphoma chrysanthemicola]|nr:hypothetical protein BKA63DRAFT_554688 [Paraphoma chrysanthemicola]